jgi:hypothetical protein
MPLEVIDALTVERLDHQARAEWRQKYIHVSIRSFVSLMTSFVGVTYTAVIHHGVCGTSPSPPKFIVTPIILLCIKSSSLCNRLKSGKLLLEATGLRTA